MIYKITILFFLLISANANAKGIVPELVFLNHLLKNNSEVIDYISESELAKSSRFGITYANEPVKFLINYNIPSDIKDGIIKHGKKFHADVLRLEEDYTVLEFSLQDKSYSTKFYFKNGKCIAPVTYFSRNYHRDSSKYFDFYIKNPLYFNEYCKKELDHMVGIYFLKLSAEELNEIAEKKIIYVFCDEADMMNILGENAKGVYLVANDVILSTYNAHYHEVMHFIMNYKLKNDIKPCHPFFLEGFATGMAGRGGLLIPSLIPVANYSVNSGLVNVKSLLSVKNFLNEDPSITYPIAGVYSFFLIIKIGFEAYKSYYLKYSGDYEYLNRLDSTNMELPYINEFFNLLTFKSMQFVKIDVAVPPDDANLLIDDPEFKLYRNDSNYIFLLSNNVLFKNPKYVFNYKSRLFEEKFPGMEYLNYSILIEANSDEVNVYYLHSNYLVLTYKKAFDLESRNVSKVNDFYIFSIPVLFFTESLLEDLKFVTFD